jgi:hypothetical protein
VFVVVPVFVAVPVAVSDVESSVVRNPQEAAPRRSAMQKADDAVEP